MSKKRILINTIWVITIIATIVLMFSIINVEINIPSDDDIFGNAFVMPAILLLFIGLYVAECYFFINIKRIVKVGKLNMHIVISSIISLVLCINTILMILLSDLAFLKDTLGDLTKLFQTIGINKNNIEGMLWNVFLLVSCLIILDLIYYVKSKYRFNKIKTERKRQRLHNEISIKLLVIYSLIMVVISCFFYVDEYEITSFIDRAYLGGILIDRASINIILNLIKVAPYLLFTVYILFFHEKKMFRGLVPLALGFMLLLETIFFLAQFGAAIVLFPISFPLVFSTKICLVLGIFFLFKGSMNGFEYNDDISTSVAAFLMGKMDLIKPFIVLVECLGYNYNYTDELGYFLDFFASIGLFFAIYIFARKNRIEPIIVLKSKEE